MTHKFTDIFMCDLVAHVHVGVGGGDAGGEKEKTKHSCLFLWSALILNLTHLHPLCCHLHLFSNFSSFWCLDYYRQLHEKCFFSLSIAEITEKTSLSESIRNPIWQFHSWSHSLSNGVQFNVGQIPVKWNLFKKRIAYCFAKIRPNQIFHHPPVGGEGGCESRLRHRIASSVVNKIK